MGVSFRCLGVSFCPFGRNSTPSRDANYRTVSWLISKRRATALKGISACSSSSASRCCSEVSFLPRCKSSPSFFANANSREVIGLVELTGSCEQKNKGIPFTASDLTDRLLPAALRQAYSQGRALEVRGLIEQAQILEPTPPPESVEEGVVSPQCYS